MSEAAPPRFDLQSHSLHSDGALAPAEVVHLAARAGVALLSLTDHDTVDGVAEAARAAEQEGLRLIRGVEISALDSFEGDLHILGYLIDDRDSQLSRRLESYRAQRARRAEAMQEALREVGFELDDQPLRARAQAGQSIGRPHLAKAVADHPANAARLAAEGRTDPSAVLEGYLIEGAPAFCPRQGPTVGEAVAAIHAAGGVAVWAHPFWDVADPAAVRAAVDRFAALGLDGVECFYVTHDREQTERLVDLCERGGLLSTGSSDFHGPDHRQFRRFRAFSTFGRRANLGPLIL
jgi:predicted metal-dependent phosphoesterase TrpH